MMNGILLLAILALGPEKVENGIRFTYYDPNAKHVYLVGDFNNWDVTATPMKRDEKGTFYIDVSLSPGRHEYKFYVDGQWIADPYNPITVGPYGNSVIQVDENGNLVPVTPTSNTPLSSMVFVNSDIRSFLRFDRDSLENRLRLSQNEADIKLDISAQLTGVKLWSRLRYNTVSNLDTTTRLVPVQIERALLTIGSNPLIKAFYNKWVYESDEPFHLVGFEGEYREPFGRDEQGIIFEIRPKFLPKILTLYSNEIATDRDILFLRLKKKISIMNMGYSIRILDAFNRQYQVPSPDSITAPDDTTLINFNLFDRDYVGSFDLTLLPTDKVSITSAFALGKRYVVAGENDVDGSKSLWVRDNRKWTKFSLRRWGVYPKFEAGNLKIGFHSEREELVYDSLFLKGNDREFVYTRVGFNTSYENERLKFGFEATQTSTKSPEEFPWEYLFDYSWNSRIEYFEFPLVGYLAKAVFKPYLKVKPLGRLSLWLTYRGEFSWSVDIPDVLSSSWPARYVIGLVRPDLYATPFTSIEVLGIDFYLGRWRLYAEDRMIKLEAPKLMTSMSYNTIYGEISYSVTPSALLRISYGLRPWDLNDDYRARREFLKENGVTDLILRKGFLRLGRAMSAAERELSKINSLTIWAELRF